MFKLFVIVMLCVIAIHSCAAADVSIITANVPMMDKGYVFININGHRDVWTVPFNIHAHYWSW